MAARTRRQYLTDLAESGANNITIEQANMSGRVGEQGHIRRGGGGVVEICACMTFFIAFFIA